MRDSRRHSIRVLAIAALVSLPVAALAQRGGANSPFPGGENPDGSLKPTGRLQRLFSQDAYTEYALLEPGTEQFRIRFLTEETRAGATELVNATRGGSEGTDVEVYDPRTGKPLPFTYEAQGENHAIHAKLTAPVPAGGIGRVLIYKTYKDPRTYQVYSEANAAFGIQPGDITWVRSLSGYRLGVILPKGYAFLSSNVAAQLSTLPDGRLELHFANPSGLSNPLTIHARKTTAELTTTPFTDMFFDDVKTLYDLGEPQTHAIKVEQIYSDFRKGDKQPVDLMAYAPLDALTVIDLDTAKPLTTSKERGGTMVKLDVPIENEKQSAHLKVTGTLQDPGYSATNGVLTFDRPMKGLRNTILLPAGWEVSSVSQSGTIGIYQGRAFVALVNLNAENAYRVVVTAKKRA
ncbi:MAG TPA: hypothetical protein VK636_13900 [Gemmatimonadaceae bacterium]|nr:hypothetical protein [Gemmatimonadaceae bacterium]